MPNPVRYLLPCIALAALLGGCATNPVTGGQDIVFMSESDELKLGQQVYQQVMQQYGVYPDIELQNYVQHVGGTLAAQSHRSNLQYKFTVLDSKEVNAFALPGGYVFITRGLMAYLNSEAQLAAVLGHEIGHITARHAVRQHSATQLTGIGAALGAAFIPGLAQAGGSQITGMLGQALLSGYGRDHELEADQLGTEYLARTSYDPDAMMQVIRVLKSQELYEIKAARAEGRQPHIYHGLFASHPDNDTRLQEVIATAGKVAEVKSPKTGRAEYFERIEGLTYGESRSQGVLRGRDFYHGELGFAVRFPGSWQITNLPDRLVAIAPGNSAHLQLTLGGVAITGGPREYLLKKMGIQQPGNEQSLKINGLPAHTATAVVKTDDGERIARLTVIYLGNRAYILAGLTRDPRGLGSYDGVFNEAARTFRPLTAEERKAAGKDQRLQIVRATDNTSFTALAKQSPLKSFAEEQIRLINGRYPTGEIKSGELLKAVHQ